MARGRPKKKRLSRMDAAIDAMAILGFPEGKVKKVVKELLTVYESGDDGWRFIEESAYSVLIEAMLDSNENDQEKRAEDCHQLLLEDKPYADEGASSSRVPTQLEDNSPQDITPLQIDPVVPNEVEAENGNANQASLSLSRSHVRPCYGWIEESDDEEEPTQLQNTDNVIPIAVEAENWNANPASLASSSPLPLPLSHERPCYGWIENDDEEPFDFICLKSPPLRVAKKGKSRWDEKPDG